MKAIPWIEVTTFSRLLDWEAVCPGCVKDLEGEADAPAGAYDMTGAGGQKVWDPDHELDEIACDPRTPS